MIDTAHLSLLASALAGVHLQVSEVDEASSCDGGTLLLERTLSDEHKLLACAAQALWTAAGTLHVPQITRLIGRAAAVRRYLALELARALERHGERLPFRLEQGLRALAPKPQTRSAEASLQCALRDRSLAGIDPRLGTLRPARLGYARARGSQPPPPTDDSFEQHADDAELDDDGKSILNALTSPLGGNPVGNLFLKLLGFGSARTGQGDEALSGGPQSLDASAATSALGREQSGYARSGGPLTLRPERPTAFAYPEWNGARYLAAHTHVHELLPERRAGLARERARIGKRALRGQLARVGVEFEHRRGQPDGTDFDLDRLIEFAVQRRQGADGRRLYKASQRSKRDLTLLVLLDVSASTREQTSHGQTIFGQQRELAREIVATTQHLGDRAALYAFHSQGRHHVHCLRIKGFSERFGKKTHERLDGLTPGGLSRLGAAIRHGTQLLEREPHHSHRVLLTLTDGFAYDDGYERAYAEGDTAKALAEAAARGIACVCLNVGSAQDDETLTRLYGQTAYLRCADPQRAVPKLRKLMRNALLAAGH